MNNPSSARQAQAQGAGLNVRAQLALGFAAIGALLAVAAVLVVQAGLGVQAALAGSAERAMPKWQAAHAVTLAVSDLARLTRDAVLVEMQEDLPAALAQMQAVQQRLHAAMKTLRAAPDDDQERALLQRVEDAATVFERDRQAFVNHLQGGARGLARGMLTGALRQSQAAYLAALDAHRARQDQRVARATADARQAMRRLSWQLAAAFTAITVVGTAVAVWLARGLSRRLGADPREVAQAMRSVSDGDLGARLAPHAACAQGSVMASLIGMVDGLRQAVRSVREASDTLAGRSEAIVADSEHLSRRTEQQSAELQQAAAALEQFAASMAHSRQNVRDADERARQARELAAQSRAAVDRATEKMHAVTDFGARVAETTAVIDGLAFQTNILALNAAVEAARAGDRGQGFAVVAGEVRQLALSSAESARRIGALIRSSNEAIHACQADVDAARTRTETVIGAVDAFAALMAQVDRASAEQTVGVQQLTEVLSRIDQFTQHNASLVEGSRAAAGALQDQSRQLLAAVEHFRLGDEPAAAQPAASG